MRRTSIVLAAALVAIIAGSLYAAGRSSSSEPRPAAPASATSTPVPNETARIYVAAIASASGLDRPSNGWSKLFIVDAPYDGVAGPPIAPRRGEPLGTPGTPRRGEPFDPAVRAEIEKSIRDIAPVEWVSDPADAIVTKDGCAVTRNGGSLIKVGPIKRVGDHVEVGVNAYLACLAAHWLTYRLDRGDDGTWRVTGTVGPQAIS